MTFYEAINNEVSVRFPDLAEFRKRPFPHALEDGHIMSQFNEPAAQVDILLGIFGPGESHSDTDRDSMLRGHFKGLL